MKTQRLHHPQAAAQLLQAGEIVALPTETVYGLAGNATDTSVVAKIFKAKERPYFDPLIVHVSEEILKNTHPINDLIAAKIVSPEVASWKNFEAINQGAKYFWPGPLTLILPKGELISTEVTGGQETVGIRCPKHFLFQEVLKLIPFPLAAPSANRFGRISPTTTSHVYKELDGRIAGVLEGGPCDVGVESSIIRIEENKITLLRPGKVSKSEIERIFKIKVDSAPSLVETVSPGMLDEHYAPTKPLYLLPFSFDDRENTKDFLAQYKESTSKKAAFLAMKEFPAALRGVPGQTFRSLSPSGSIEEMAKKLFATLRELDENDQVSVIFADSPSPMNEGLAASIYDRLKRASRNKPS